MLSVTPPHFSRACRSGAAGPASRGSRGEGGAGLGLGRVNGQQGLQGVGAHEAHARRGCVPGPEVAATLRHTRDSGCAARGHAAPLWLLCLGLCVDWSTHPAPDGMSHRRGMRLTRARATAPCPSPQEEPQGESSGLQVVVLNLPWSATTEALKVRVSGCV